MWRRQSKSRARTFATQALASSVCLNVDQSVVGRFDGDSSTYDGLGGTHLQAEDRDAHVESAHIHLVETIHNVAVEGDGLAIKALDDAVVTARRAP